VHSKEYRKFIRSPMQWRILRLFGSKNPLSATYSSVTQSRCGLRVSLWPRTSCFSVHFIARYCAQHFAPCQAFVFQEFPQNFWPSQPSVSSSCRLSGGASGGLRVACERIYRIPSASAWNRMGGIPKNRCEMISSFSHRIRNFICCSRNVAAK
jgi:hypothetical protein